MGGEKRIGLESANARAALHEIRTELLKTRKEKTEGSKNFEALKERLRAIENRYGVAGLVSDRLDERSDYDNQLAALKAQEEAALTRQAQAGQLPEPGVAPSFALRKDHQLSGASSKTIAMAARKEIRVNANSVTINGPVVTAKVTIGDDQIRTLVVDRQKRKIWVDGEERGADLDLTPLYAATPVEIAPPAQEVPPLDTRMFFRTARFSKSGETVNKVYLPDGLRVVSFVYDPATQSIRVREPGYRERKAYRDEVRRIVLRLEFPDNKRMAGQFYRFASQALSAFSPRR